MKRTDQGGGEACIADILLDRRCVRARTVSTPWWRFGLLRTRRAALIVAFMLGPAYGCATSSSGTPSVVAGPGSPSTAAETSGAETETEAETADPTDVPIDGPTSPRAQAIDADVRGLLAEVYGAASLVGEERIEGAGETIEELRYRLGRAHGPEDGATLVQALGELGYAIERALVDDAAAAIFAFAHGSSLIMKADVGSTSLVISIATHGAIEG
jgi:hypothetical protein